MHVLSCYSAGAGGGLSVTRRFQRDPARASVVGAWPRRRCSSGDGSRGWDRSCGSRRARAAGPATRGGADHTQGRRAAEAASLVVRVGRRRPAAGRRASGCVLGGLVSRAASIAASPWGRSADTYGRFHLAFERPPLGRDESLELTQQSQFYRTIEQYEYRSNTVNVYSSYGGLRSA